MSAINLDTVGWDFDYYTMFDDPSTTTASEHECWDCTKHVVRVTNDHDADQTVHIGGHVWQDRTYGWSNYDCQAAQWGSGNIAQIKATGQHSCKVIDHG